MVSRGRCAHRSPIVHGARHHPRHDGRRPVKTRLETPLVTLVEEVHGDRLAALYAASVAYALPSQQI